MQNDIGLLSNMNSGMLLQVTPHPALYKHDHPGQYVVGRAGYYMFKFYPMQRLLKQDQREQSDHKEPHQEAQTFILGTQDINQFFELQPHKAP